MSAADHWPRTVERLRAVAERHGADAIAGDGWIVLSTADPQIDPIRATDADEDGVKVEAGWFISFYPGCDDESEPAVSLVDAIMSGGAKETVYVDGDRLVDHGWSIEAKHVDHTVRPTSDAAGMRQFTRQLPSW